MGELSTYSQLSTKKETAATILSVQSNRDTSLVALMITIHNKKRLAQTALNEALVERRQVRLFVNNGSVLKSFSNLALILPHNLLDKTRLK